MNTKLKNLTAVLPIFLLSACKTEIAPEWESYFTLSEQQDSRVEWQSDIAVDSYGDIISGGSTVLTGANRRQDVLVVKHDSHGNLLWSADLDLADGTYRSDDKITDLVLDEDDNTYAVGVRYIVENGEQRYGSFILKLDRDGNVQWVHEISEHEDARDIEIHNNQLYVTGYSTQVFSTEGHHLLSIEHDKAWDIEVDADGNIYIVGASQVQKYQDNGNLDWSYGLPGDLFHQSSIVVNSQGGVTVAHNHQDDRSTRVRGLSADGELIWSKTYHPAKQSYGFPGPALLEQDWRDNVVLSLSNDKGRRIVKLDETGNELWQVTSQGIVQDFVLDDDGAVYAVGGGVNEKYDANGEFIASTVAVSGTQITTGSVALNGDEMYVGYSAVNNGDIQLYLSKYLDQ